MCGKAEYTVIKYEAKDRVATIALNNPAVMNALDVAMVTEIVTAMDEAKDDENIKCIVLTGVDKAFCAGGDIMTLLSATLAQGADMIRKEGEELIRAFMGNPKPIIAAVNGYAVGAGLSLVLIADYVVAKESIKMGASFAKIGLIPDTGALYLLPRHVGLHRAKEIVYTGKNYTARQMLEWGIGNKVVPDEEFEDAVKEAAGMFAGGAGLAMGYAKLNMHRELDTSLHAALEMDAAAQAILMQTEDKNEGIQAFLEKRKANFQ
ncbi:MAG: enoyl-CoA hydratase/isomerase family protein [Clostridiales Family XIII bacterium]|jgi:2-(1,2-epoxy-1,2-dihydrophenyl)acetyl-CoA isomerase|nr:enoyl-CoA hydratase/isomerase family protein [Clostridiales Family XIII bacterium]